MEEVVRDRLSGGIFPGRRVREPVPRDRKTQVIRQS
jgi:hypothetical protein